MAKKKTSKENNLGDRKNWPDEVKNGYKVILLQIKKDIYDYVPESEVDIALSEVDKIEELIDFTEKRLDYLKLVRNSIEQAEREAIRLRMLQTNNDYSFR